MTVCSHLKNMTFNNKELDNVFQSNGICNDKIFAAFPRSAPAAPLSRGDSKPSGTVGIGSARADP